MIDYKSILYIYPVISARPPYPPTGAHVCVVGTPFLIVTVNIVTSGLANKQKMPDGFDKKFLLSFRKATTKVNVISTFISKWFPPAEVKPNTPSHISQYAVSPSDVPRPTST